MMQSMDIKALRNVLGCYATGVAVITANVPGKGPVAVTVNSFASLSLDPPLIQFALARTANVLAGFQKAAHFAVNILSRKMESTSNMFARPSTACWSDVDYADSPDGCPLIAGCVAQIECEKNSELAGGDHVILLGKVIRFHLREEAGPLLFYRGRYGTYVSNLWSKLPPAEGSLADFAVTGWG